MRKGCLGGKASFTTMAVAFSVLLVVAVGSVAKERESKGNGNKNGKGRGEVEKKRYTGWWWGKRVLFLSDSGDELLILLLTQLQR